jgi:hypothetical protein
MMFNFKYLFTLLLISSSSISCSTMKHQPNYGTIEGHIYNATGNQMPGPGKDLQPNKGAVREIWIFEPTAEKQVTGTSPLFNTLSTKSIAHTTSDSTGHYQIKLPAGRYSIFIKESSGYFAAESDGTGILNPVEVSIGHTTTKDITITLNAVY